MPIRPAEMTDWPGISRLLTQLEYPGTERFLKTRLTAMLNDPAETLLVWAEPSPASPAENAASPSAARPALPAASTAGPASQPPPPTAGPASPLILGFLSLHFIPQIALEADFARISYFAVDNDARSNGIGRQLEETATRLARDRGCELIEVHCHSRRTRAHDFYRRQGYEESPKYLIKRLK